MGHDESVGRTMSIAPLANGLALTERLKELFLQAETKKRTAKESLRSRIKPGRGAAVCISTFFFFLDHYVNRSTEYKPPAPCHMTARGDLVGSDLEVPPD